MSKKHGGFWGTAIGLDRTGTSRRIGIFETSGGFRFVDENLHSGPHRSPSADHIRPDVATIFGLRDVALELPRLGIYSSAKALISAGPAKPLLAPKAGSDVWGTDQFLFRKAADLDEVRVSISSHAGMSVVGTSRTNRLYRSLSPIGLTADQCQAGSRTDRQRMTHNGHPA